MWAVLINAERQLEMLNQSSQLPASGSGYLDEDLPKLCSGDKTHASKFKHSKASIKSSVLVLNGRGLAVRADRWPRLSAFCIFEYTLKPQILNTFVWAGLAYASS
eukprot:g74479.t1